MTDADTLPTLGLNPQGHLAWCDRDGEPWPVEAAMGRVAAAFSGGVTPGLLHLAAREPETQLPAVLDFWRRFARLYLTRFCHRPEAEGLERPTPGPAGTELATLVEHAPPMVGGEYLSVEALQTAWARMDEGTRAEAARSAGGVEGFLKGLGPLWRTVGRVCFHLAENSRNSQYPFAFMATYSCGISAGGKLQHRPLGQALRDHAGAGQQAALLRLLLPVHHASERCPWLKAMVASGDLFKPLAWGPDQAFRFLKESPVFEESGVVIRLPDRWGGKPPARPAVSVRVGEERKAGLGVDALLDFKVGITLGDESLTPEEWKALMDASAGLVMIRGRWVEADPERLRETLAQWKKAEKAAAQGVSFGEALRLLTGAGGVTGGGPWDVTPETRPWLGLQAGRWLDETLASLRDPARLGGARIPHGLDDVLRPYQKAGVEWLRFMSALGLGACLADDMGLGKTVQILALLSARKKEAAGGAPRPCLLVAPASLLSNWQAEVRRFTPALKTRVLHPSDMAPEAWRKAQKHVAAAVVGVDLVLTTYGMVAKWDDLRQLDWDVVALDEAQAIKNPSARQTRAVKALRARQRIALTGTPIENRLGDLWSLFDFLNPGLLGSAKRFGEFVKAGTGDSERLGALRHLVRPYILRRLKTDKRIITDLPDKTEVKAFCPLAARQAALYEQAVRDMKTQLEAADGIARRGVVLGAIMRLKQICNHPSHWLRDQAFESGDSGKFIRLRALAEEVAGRQEKMLVFTQFEEMTGPLAGFLSGVFRRTGLILHGAVPVKDRRRLVETFQDEAGPPFFVLTTKAGGTGLNLTAASHVIHFDRWWNPAVENQATDRAFRIGQKRNVLVHKFVCRGTFEEKIDALLEEKSALARDVVDGEAGGARLTEMNNEELLRFVALDIDRAGDAE
jgi:non-specific serine/threonine protein kinase